MTVENVKARANGTPPMKAPYTFVGTGNRVLPSPVTDLDLSRPVEGAISGRITVTWTAATPILVGGGEAESETPDNNAPLKIGNQYALPGSTLKGLIRSVMEIASFARLSFVEDYAAFTRNFMDATWVDEVRMDRNGPNGGWLFCISENGKPAYRLVPATDTPACDFDTFLPELGVSSHDDWHDMTLHARLQTIETAGRDGRNYLPGQPGEARLVVSGPTPPEGRNKHREYLFHWPDDITATDRRIVDIDPGTARRFIMSQHRDSNEDRKKGKPPEANYDALTAPGRVDGFDGFDQSADRTRPAFTQQLENPDKYGLPVFWRNPKGAAQAACGRKPILSLTALYRVPYDRSVHDLVARHNRTLPPEQLDLVQALLGWAPPETPETRIANRKGVEKSLRSRVMFGFATSDNAEAETTPRTWAATRPRPSFWPFYLRPATPDATHPVDYNNPAAILSGRKRYPARGEEQKLVNGDDLGWTDIQKNDRESSLTFLKPGANFTGDIRVRNVSLIELGALIWAITFGDLVGNQGYFHMIGRAKPYGYGQVKAAITGSLNMAGDGATVDWQAAIDAFTGWVRDRTGTDFDRLEPIRMLLGTAHADTGKLLRDAGCLEWPKVNDKAGESQGQKVLNAYGAIKERAQRRLAGQTVEEPRSVGLPAWPAPENGDSLLESD